MDVIWLRGHVAHLKKHLIHFEQMNQQSETFYRNSLLHIKDPDTKSSLMEQYSRQQKILQRMQELYQQALNQLTDLEVK